MTDPNKWDRTPPHLEHSEPSKPDPSHLRKLEDLAAALSDTCVALSQRQTQLEDRVAFIERRASALLKALQALTGTE